MAISVIAVCALMIGMIVWRSATRETQPRTRRADGVDGGYAHGGDSNNDCDAGDAGCDAGDGGGGDGGGGD